MKKIKALLFTLAILFSVNLNAANADVLGCANYKKIEQNYNYAKAVYKQVDDKVLDLQKFLMQKEKDYKKIESPINRKNFEEQTQKEYKAKEDTVLKYKVAKEEEVYNNIINATKAIAKEKKIDTVIDYRMIFVGGVDLTDEIIKYLNTKK